jgi:hypothetical protein
MKVALFAALLMSGCNETTGTKRQSDLPYDLLHPAGLIALPAILHEVSGIVARSGQTLYVLKSDGTIFEIPDLSAGHANTIAHITGVPAANNEGLCFDKEENRLLIASKGLTGKPAYNFSTIGITQHAVDLGIHEPYRATARGKAKPNLLKVRASDLAIHPLTGHLYMLAAADYLLLVFDRSGKLLHLEKLDPVVFNQAEGITFLQNGDMLISNEGGDDKPTLLRFSFKPTVGHPAGARR